MHAFVIRAMSGPDGDGHGLRHYAVLAASVEEAMVAMIRERPLGTLIEATARVLAPDDPEAQTLEVGRPKPLP